MLRHRLASIVILAVAIMALMSPAFAAGSGEDPPANPPTIKPEVRHDPRPAAERPATLPFTGADMTAFALVGLASVGGGTVIVRRTRSRRPQP